MSAERRRRVWKTSFGQQCFEVKMLITRKGEKTLLRLFEERKRTQCESKDLELDPELNKLLT